MQIRLADIGQEGLELEEQLAVPWLLQVFSGDLQSPFRPVGASTVTGRIQRVGLDIVVQLASSLTLSTECASCTRPFEVSVSVSCHQVFKPARRKERALDAEVELEAEELNEASYSGDSLDLDEFLREQILLALPMFPHCSETCQGLCPVCGADLNEKRCGCERVEIDPRLEPLKVLKVR